MAVDLIGRIPTIDELDVCLTQTPQQMADGLMRLPAYVELQRRRWAEWIAYDDYLVWHGYLVELDALVARHYRDEISYPELAAQVVMHPGF